MTRVVKQAPCRNCGETVKVLIDPKLETVAQCPKCIR